MSYSDMKQREVMQANVFSLIEAVELLLSGDDELTIPNIERCELVMKGIALLDEIILGASIDLSISDIVHLLSLACYCQHLTKKRVQNGELLAETMTNLQHIVSSLMQHLTNFESE